MISLTSVKLAILCFFPNLE